MSILSKLKFWKKSDDFGLNDDLTAADPSMNLNDPSMNLNDPSMNMNQDNLGLNAENPDLLSGGQPNLNATNPSPSTGGFDSVDSPSSLHDKSQFDDLSAQNNQFQQTANKDFDLISSKLDTIKAELDSMNQRIMKIERIAEQSDKEVKETKKALW